MMTTVSKKKERPQPREGGGSPPASERAAAGETIGSSSVAGTIFFSGTSSSWSLWSSSPSPPALRALGASPPPPPLSPPPGVWATSQSRPVRYDGGFYDGGGGETLPNSAPSAPNPLPHPAASSALSLLLSNLATTTTSAAEAALRRSLSPSEEGLIVEDSEGSDDGGGGRGGETYVTPCGSLPPVQESTSALLTARALSKVGGGERSRTGGDGDDESEEAASVLFSTPPSAASSAADDDADAAEEAYRSILSSAFGPMGENGFVPRYAYPAGGGRGDEDGVNSPPYLYGTIYPSPRMFGSRSAPSRYLPPSGPIPPEEEDPTRSGLASGSALGGGRSSSFSSSLRRASISGISNGRSGDGGRSALWSGSGRISSPPLHATMIMDSFYLSRQLPADLNCLAESFRSLLMWHRFLHEEVLGSDCDPIVPVIGGGAGVGVGPSCHNVVHPWESDVPANSPIWETALRWVVENEIRRKEGGWRPVFDVPPEIRGSYDYPGDELYRAGLYLIECAENATAEFEEEGERGGEDRWRQSDRPLFLPRVLRVLPDNSMSLRGSGRDVGRGPGPIRRRPADHGPSPSRYQPPLCSQEGQGRRGSSLGGTELGGIKEPME